MPTTTIHFVRHGKVYNPDHLLYERLPGFHLSDRGMRMAQATGAYIAADPKLNAVAAVYSSPLERTRETAGAILDALNPVRAGRGEEPLELITDPRVIEAGNEFRGKRIGHGKGALWRDGNWKLVLNLWKPSWGESYRRIAERVGAFANEKIREYAGRQIIANRLWWSATNRRFSVIAIIWRPATPSIGCSYARPRSRRSPRSPTTAIRAR